jgi:hypothetical protein
MHHKVIDFLPHPRRGVWRFAAGEALQRREGDWGFYFPGRLAADGLWADLPAEGRVTVLALAALAQAQTRTEDAFLGLPPGVRCWLDEIGAVEVASDGCELLVRRLGSVHLEPLCAITGLPAERLGEALAGLSYVMTQPLVHLHVEEGEVWYHLPGTWWQPYPMASCV